MSLAWGIALTVLVAYLFIYVYRVKQYADTLLDLIENLLDLIGSGQDRTQELTKVTGMIVDVMKEWRG